MSHCNTNLTNHLTDVQSIATLKQKAKMAFSSTSVHYSKWLCKARAQQSLGIMLETSDLWKYQLDWEEVRATIHPYCTSSNKRLFRSVDQCAVDIVQQQSPFFSHWKKTITSCTSANLLQQWASWHSESTECVTLWLLKHSVIHYILKSDSQLAILPNRIRIYEIVMNFVWEVFI